MMEAVISGDVIASTSLSDSGRNKLEVSLREMLQTLQQKYNVYGRLIKGDYLECYVPELANAFRIALAIKSFVKSIPLESNDFGKPSDTRIKFFKMHGIRLAIGIGTLSRLNIEKGIIDGEAIYNSGRIINDNKTFNKEKVVIKNTLFIKSPDDALDKELEPLLALIDVLFSKCTAKQSEVIYLKLLGNSEEFIAKKMGINQPTVNQHSTSSGWNAIEKAVQRYEFVIKNLN